MARIVSDNCGDTYSWSGAIPYAWAYGKDENLNNSVAGSVTTTAGSTGNCLQIDSQPFGSIASFLRKNLPASYGHLIYGFRFKTLALPGTAYDHIAVLWDNAANILCLLAVDAAGSLSVWRGGYPMAGGTLVGTATAGDLIQSGTMIHLSLDITLDNAGAGAFTLRANSKIVKTASSVTTAPNASGAAMFSVHSGSILASSHLFDDIWINDTTGSANTGFDGDIKNLVFLPTAAGRLTQQAIGGSGAAATNWQSVNQAVPDDDVTYVAASASGLKDTYKVAALPADVVTIVCVDTIMDAKTDTSGLGAGATVCPLIGNGTTESVGADVSVNTSYAAKMQSFGINPITGLAWTLADWSTIEIGHKRTA